MTTSPLKTPLRVLRSRETNLGSPSIPSPKSPSKADLEAEGFNSAATSPRLHSTEMGRVLGRLVGRASSRSKASTEPNEGNTNRATVVIGPSKRAREDGYLASPARKLFRSAPAAPASMPSPKAQSHTAPRSSVPAHRAGTARRTPTPTRVSGSPTKPLPILPQPSTSPLEVDLAEFDAIFADFPLPPSASQASSSTLSLPVAGSAGKSRLEDALRRLEGVWTALRAEVGQEEERRGKMYLLEKEVQRTKAKVDIYRRKVEEMEGMLAREKSERGRAAAEARGMVAHLEKRLAKEQEDRKSAEAALSLTHLSEASADRRFFDLQQQLDAALQTISRSEFAAQAREEGLIRSSRDREEAIMLRAKEREEGLTRQAAEKEQGFIRQMREKEVGWKRRLEEAEFAHRALKEGGARLARELEKKDRLLDEAEKRGKRFV